MHGCVLATRTYVKSYYLNGSSAPFLADDAILKRYYLNKMDSYGS